MSALRRRGQPLAALALVLAGWVGVRAAVWEPPFGLPGPVATAAMAGRGAPLTGLAQPVADLVRNPADLDPPQPTQPAAVAIPPLAATARDPVMPLIRPAPETLVSEPPAPGPLAFAPAAAPQAIPATPPRVAAAHQLLYLAALGRLPLPPGLALLTAPQRPAAAPAAAPPPMLATAAVPRWSGDAWLLLRRGSGGLAAAPGFPAYGASQIGGVIRFALAPTSPRAPQAYLRVSRAIGGFAESEVAAGLSARPFARVPLRLYGEARVQRSGGSTRVRPAASLVSELPPVRLPLGIAGEAYAQVGYAGTPIGSKRGATSFFDVQAIADRKLASAGPAELRLGAGVWSGGQKGAARLDLGPRASLRLDTAPVRSRLALDWRFRVAGEARPGSGPTLTLSAGF